MATVLIAICMVPALEALQSGIQGAAVHESNAVNQQRLNAKLEEVLAAPLSDLDAAALAAGDTTTPTGYSDSAGTNDRRLVYLSRYDGDNADADDDPFTGVDEGLIWVRVAIDNSTHARETLTGDP